jgi:hypothetical protein
VRDWQAVQRANVLAPGQGSVGGFGRGQRLFRQEGNDRVDRGVDPLDLSQVRIHHLDGGHIAVTDARREVRGVKETQVTHDSFSPVPRRVRFRSERGHKRIIRRGVPALYAIGWGHWGRKLRVGY